MKLPSSHSTKSNWLPSLRRLSVACLFFYIDSSSDAQSLEDWDEIRNAGKIDVLYDYCLQVISDEDQEQSDLHVEALVTLAELSISYIVDLGEAEKYIEEGFVLNETLFPTNYIDNIKRLSSVEKTLQGIRDPQANSTGTNGFFTELEKGHNYKSLVRGNIKLEKATNQLRVAAYKIVNHSGKLNDNKLRQLISDFDLKSANYLNVVENNTNELTSQFTYARNRYDKLKNQSMASTFIGGGLFVLSGGTLLLSNEKDRSDVLNALFSFSTVTEAKQRFNNAGYKGSRSSIRVNPSSAFTFLEQLAIYERLGAIYYRLGEYLNSCKYYELGINLAELTRPQFSDQTSRIRFSGSRTQLYNGIVDCFMELGEFEIAFNYSEKARARVFLDDLASSRKGNLPSTASDDLARMFELQRSNAIMLENRINDPRQLNKINDNYRNINLKEEKLLVDSKDSIGFNYILNQAFRPVEYENFSSVIPPDVTIISYFATENNLWAWGLTNHRVYGHKVKITMDYLLKYIQIASIDQIYNLGSEQIDEKQLKLFLAGLGKVLIEPFCSILSPNQKILVINDQLMDSISFASLILNDKYLVQSHSIIHAESVNSWLLIRNRKIHSSTSVGIAAGYRGDKYSNIPYAQMEGVALKNLCSDRNIEWKFLEHPISKQEVQNLLQNYTICHFATHGSYDRNSPLKGSQIVFGDAQGQQISAWEFRDYKINANTIFINACWSGRNFSLNGRETFGFVRSLELSGARNIVIALRPIKDGQAAYFSDEFYRHLLDGIPVDEAVRRAQLKAISTESDIRKSIWPLYIVRGAP